jgi:hypothetical protein
MPRYRGSEEIISGPRQIQEIIAEKGIDISGTYIPKTYGHVQGQYSWNSS